MSEQRFQFTLTGLLVLVALVAGYFWLIRNPAIGGPLVFLGLPTAIALYLMFVVIPRALAGDPRTDGLLGWFWYRPRGVTARRRGLRRNDPAASSPARADEPRT